MARRGRAPSGVETDIKGFSFKLDNADGRERAFRQFIEERNLDPNWNLRDYLTELWHMHHGNVRNDANDVADAIREATQGLWDMFNDLMQNRGTPVNRENFQRFANDQGVDEFDEDFVNGMLDTFGKLDDDD